MQPYRHNLQHLHDEFRRLDLRLKSAVSRLRHVPQDQPGDFRHAYISEQEIDHILATRAATPPVTEAVEAESVASALADEINARVAASAVAGTIDLRFVRLCRAFSLSGFESDVVLLALAPELDLGYLRIYAYLHDDATRARATIDLAMRLLCLSLTERVVARRAFELTSTLLRRGIMELHEEPQERGAPGSATALRLAPGMLDFLTSGTPRPASHVDQLKLSIPQALRTRARTIAPLATAGTLCVLHSNCDDTAAAFAVDVSSAAGGRRVHDFDARGAITTADPRAAARIAARDAVLWDANIFIRNWDAAVAEASQTAQDMLITLADAATVFLSTTATASPRAWSGRVLHVELPALEATDRLALWDAHLRNGHPAPPSFDLPHIASAFRFTPEQIARTVRRAQIAAQMHEHHPGDITREELLCACRAESTARLSSLAQHVVPRRTWGDLVLPANLLEQLRELTQQIRHRLKVFGEWGFGERLSDGKGICALFSGPSGTGKTLAAEVIANDLSLDLFRVDLARVVSKYIGETEKNLDQVFTDAYNANAILLFDEADALFGKRSEVRDAHDRYANLEIDFLLTRVDRHEGTCILTTNFASNIDDAMTRRLSLRVDFPFPDETQRRSIWAGVFPDRAPRDADIDLDVLAQRFRLSGGSIRNIALAAAFLAAEERSPIAMRHLAQSTRRELTKLGRPVTDLKDVGIEIP